MNQTWLSFPLRVIIAILLLSLVLYWQFSFDLGHYYYMQGHTEQYVNFEYDLALMNYEISLTLRPDNPGTLYQRGIVLINLNKLDEAVNSLEAALNAGYEPRWKALMPLVQLLNGLGRETEAIPYQTELEASRQR